MTTSGLIQLEVSRKGIILLMAKIKPINHYGYVRATWTSHMGNDEASSQNSFINRTYHLDGNIYHYTNLHGLFNIIESGGFWLSDHRFLNDSQEFENGRLITLDLIEKLIIQGDYGTFNEILENTKEKIKNHSRNNFYIASFCTDGDSLEQWRSYANNGDGFAIKNKLETTDLNTLPIIHLAKVTYNDNDKITILKGIINSFHAEYSKDKEDMIGVDIDAWSSSLSNNLAINFILFKKQIFCFRKRSKSNSFLEPSK